MATGGLPLLHCHRCVYSWRPIRTRVRICPRCKSKLWNVPKARPRPINPSGLGVAEVFGPHRYEVDQLKRRYKVRSLRVFGSTARGEAGEDSDVDLLVEFSQPVGLLRKTRLQLDLERVLKRKVDLMREDSLHWYVRPQALADAVTL